MADFKLEDGRISVFKVTDKKDPKGPDYTGKANVDGVQKVVSLWITEAKSGLKYMAGTVQDPLQKKGYTSKPQPGVTDDPF